MNTKRTQLQDILSTVEEKSQEERNGSVITEILQKSFFFETVIVFYEKIVEKRMCFYV